MLLCLIRLMTALFFIVLMIGCEGPTDVYQPSPNVLTSPQAIPLPNHLPTLSATLLPANLTMTPANMPFEKNIQTVTRSWSAEELLTRMTQANAPVWVEGDEITFAYRGKADEVQLCCGIQLPMQQVEGSDLWVLTVKIRGLPQAVISYGFMVMRNGQQMGNTQNSGVWRGPQAPPPVQHASPLRGQIKHYSIYSDALGEQRGLTVYLPPNYASTPPMGVIYVADGQSVFDLASLLEPLIADTRVPPILLIGVNSPITSSRNPLQDLRAQEYIPEENPTRFAAHEKFFVDEVSEWAEKELGAPSDRWQRAVFGFSNGGVFAAAMGLRHPDMYDHIIAFSLGMEPGAVTATEGTSEFYLVAGTLEEGFHSATEKFAQMLQLHSVTYQFRDRVCGHDYILWQEEFPAAVEWAFGR